MKCSNCGTEMSFGHDFCTVCGQANILGDTAQNAKVHEMGNNNDAQNYSNSSPIVTYQGEKFVPPRVAPNPYGAPPNFYSKEVGCETVSVMRWIGRMLIPFIPFVGPIVYFIMIIVWACSDRFEATSRNWAIASLIMTAIGIIIGIIVFVLMFTSFSYVLNDYVSISRII